MASGWHSRCVYALGLPISYQYPSPFAHPWRPPPNFSALQDNYRTKRQAERIHLFEYEKPDWTYHAKGLWYYLPDAELPSMTLIGSSNFGERSVNRDLEAQVCIVTANQSLQGRLHHEYHRLFSVCSAAEQEITKRAGCAPSFGSSVIFLGGHMLLLFVTRVVAPPHILYIIVCFNYCSSSNPTATYSLNKNHCFDGYWRTFILQIML